MCRLVRTGLVSYEKAHQLQKRLLEKKISGENRDFLIISEHRPVITLGRGFKAGNLLIGRDALEKRGISVYEVERGGDATYHGPGQLVGYPVFDLSRRGKDLRLFIRGLEEVIIRTLDEFNIKADRKEGNTGVWTGGKKIASIGVAVRRWISYHGFSLNIFPDLENFSFINPCGLHYNVMTSMANTLNRSISFRDVEERVTENYESVFCVKFTPFEGDEINAKGY
jgi:lipoate-protein ligase B